ncbi:MAG: T9SS type A sorting domain-containing protein, partial [Bacteroidia bacterium]|nr:T9SS type A sorting domain-containing protein [Bacteroidia bacterium]
PTTGDFVVEVGGSLEALRLANLAGNNNCFANAGFNDPLTNYANTVNNGYEGLYPLYTNPAQQAGPWEWFDSTATVFYASFLPPPFNTQGGVAYSNALLTNPNMSKAKALAYLDTVMGYLNPRIVYCLNLSTGLNNGQVNDAGLSFVPNPAEDRTVISTKNQDLIRSISVFDLTGKKVYYATGINEKSYTLNRQQLETGVYMIQVELDRGTATSRIIFR